MSSWIVTDYFKAFLQIINQENGGGKYLCLILPWRLIMMSPARPLVIGAGSGICTFCAECEREMINFVLLQSNLIEKLSSFNCQRHPRPHSPQPVWTISVPFCPKWYLTAAVAAADSCAILRPAVTAVRTSPQPPATTQLLVTFGDGKLFWQTWMSVARTPWDSYVITWAWPPDVTLCDRGGGWCELVSAPRQCQLSSVLRGHCSWLVRGQSTPSHGGEEWAETGQWSPCPHPVSQTIRPAGLGPDWQEYCESESVGYKKDTPLSQSHE